MKKVLKWGGVVVGSVLTLLLLLCLLFYFPPFQRWAVNKASRIASEKTGMRISVGYVRLAFPLDLSLENVKMLEPNDSLPGVNDTVADVRRMVADVQLWPLLRSQVMVDELSLQQMKVNTTHFIRNVRIAGRVGTLKVRAHGIDLSREHVRINTALLSDASLLVELSDTAKKDTATSENFWKVNLDDLKLRNVAFALRTPGDTIAVNTFMNRTNANGVYLDLYKSLYTVRHLDWNGGSLNYDQTFAPRTAGFDPNHIGLTNLTLRADSFSFCSPQLRLKLLGGTFYERCGLAVNNLSGPFAMDSLQLALPGLRLRTPSSDLLVHFRMDMNAFADSLPGHFSANVSGTVGRQDLMILASPMMPRNIVSAWPRVPLVVNAKLGGNLQRLHLQQLYLNLPSVLKLRADGFLSNLTGKHLMAGLNVNATGGRLDFVNKLLPASTASTVRIPNGITFRGRVNVDGDRYGSRFVATQGGGSLRGNVSIDTKRMAYNARLSANRLPLSHFLLHQPLHPFTGTIAASGAGTDVMSPRTRIHAVAHVNRMQYDRYDLNNIKLTANIQGGRIKVDADCANPMVKGLLSLDALTNGRTLEATVGCDLSHADLRKLGVVDDSLAVSLCGHVDVGTDMKHYYKVQGLLSDITVLQNKRFYRPNDLVLDILTRRDTTHAVVDCNDFHLNLNAHGGYEPLIKSFSRLMAEAQRQMKERTINQERFYRLLPTMRLYASSGNDNFIMRVLHHYGVNVGNLLVDMASSPATGINGSASVGKLVVDSIPIDTVSLHITTADDRTMSYNLEVENKPDNPTYVFHAFLDGAVTENGTWMKPRIYDAQGRLGIGMGLMASIHNHGVSLHLFGDEPILGYKKFAVNDSNYIYLGDDRRVRADMKLRADDGMGVQIYSNNDNTEALQDVTVDLHQFNLGQVLSVIPYAPDIKGVMDGDFHLVQTSEQLSISSTVNVDNLMYGGSPMGNVGTEFTYMPKSDGSHYVDGIITRDGNEVGTLTGTYYSAGKGVIDASMALNRMPMSYLNGFIPDKIIGFNGYAEGTVKLKGAPSTPDVNGELYLDSCHMYSEPYGVSLRFANDPVAIQDSHIQFENFEVFANNDSPLNVQGSLDFSDLSRMALNVRMRADNFELIDAKETARSEAFGKAFVNFYGTMNGLVDNLKMRGRVDVLGTTDLKYNLKDSPLTTDDQLKDLVEFTNLADTTTDVFNRPPVTGLDMDLSVSIDEGAHVDCYLNAAKSNYIDVVGGGDMRMQYNVADGIILRGRYTIGSGEMKYALPVIPLKTFTIAEGSYIQFTGDPMNPQLSITATEQTKATVGESSGSGRSVDFTCGVKVSQTLNNMGLEFTIDAPEDLTIHNQLQSMTKEERGKLAVTMLTTGMYLADGNMSAFSMNSALSAFLNSQINQISSKALRTLDIGFNVDNNYTNGDTQTDYSFKFARRFWNNRLKVSIGGKISTGANVAVQDETFFDNVTLEYRLSPVSNKYLNLFYIRDSYDWLEGNVSKFGGGFIWRRKLRHFSDLFRFKGEEDLPAATPDSTAKNKKTATQTTTGNNQPSL